MRFRTLLGFHCVHSVRVCVCVCLCFGLNELIKFGFYLSKHGARHATPLTHIHTVTYTAITVTTRRLPFPALKCMLRFRICDRYWASWGQSERAKLTWPQLAAKMCFMAAFALRMSTLNAQQRKSFLWQSQRMQPTPSPSPDALCGSEAPCEPRRGEDKQNHSNRRQLRQYIHTHTLARCLSLHWQLIGQSTLRETLL